MESTFGPRFFFFFLLFFETKNYVFDIFFQGSMKALFLNHDGYLGALGTFVAPPHHVEMNEGN